MQLWSMSLTFPKYMFWKRWNNLISSKHIHCFQGPSQHSARLTFYHLLHSKIAEIRVSPILSEVVTLHCLQRRVWGLSWIFCWAPGGLENFKVYNSVVILEQHVCLQEQPGVPRFPWWCRLRKHLLVMEYYQHPIWLLFSSTSRRETISYVSL